MGKQVDTHFRTFTADQSCMFGIMAAFGVLVAGFGLMAQSEGADDREVEVPADLREGETRAIVVGEG